MFILQLFQDGSVAFDASGDQLKALNGALELLQAAIKLTEAPRILLCTGHLVMGCTTCGILV